MFLICRILNAHMLSQTKNAITGNLLNSASIIRDNLIHTKHTRNGLVNTEQSARIL